MMATVKKHDGIEVIITCKSGRHIALVDNELSEDAEIIRYESVNKAIDAGWFITRGGNLCPTCVNIASEITKTA